MSPTEHTEIFYVGNDSISQTTVRNVHSPSFSLNWEKIEHCKVTDLICLVNYIQIFNPYQETFYVRKLKQRYRVEIETFKLFTEVTNIPILQLVF